MRTVLLTGRKGQVGHELQQSLSRLGRVVALDRSQLDLADPDAIRNIMRSVAPDIIVNAAAYTAVDKAEAEPELAHRVNATAPGVMAEEARRLGALFIHYSTDYVFDGRQAAPYSEDDPPNPINAYGRSKLAGEAAITAAGGACFILRTSWIYSMQPPNFVLAILDLARKRRELNVVSDQIGSPTWARSLAVATTDLVALAIEQRDRAGIYHMSAAGHTSRVEFARLIIAMARELVRAPAGWAEVKSTTTANYPLPAARPLNSATSKARIRQVFGIEMPDWESDLRHFLRTHWAPAQD